MAGADVYVWYASLDGAWHPHLLAALSDSERSRATRFAFEGDRLRWMTSRALLRSLLGRELGVPPATVAIATSAGGKPMVAGAGGELPHFSVAHSGAVAVFALSRARDVGVDVEHEPADMTDEELGRVARGILSRDELVSLGPLLPSQRRREFFRLWVRKEAYLKATGEGLGLDPTAISVLGPAGETTALRPTVGHGASAAWTLVDLPSPAAACPAALAVRGVGVRVSCRWLEPAGEDLKARDAAPAALWPALPTAG